MKTDLNYKQCRALADKWLLLSYRSPEWKLLMQAKADITNINLGSYGAAYLYKDLRQLFLNGQIPNKFWCDEINKLNYELLTQRLTGK